MVVVLARPVSRAYEPVPGHSPRTEVFFLLGMLPAAVAGDRRDMFVDDYAAGWDQLRKRSSPGAWSCATLCGVDATLSGVALKFSRAAMAVVHPDRSTFSVPTRVWLPGRGWRCTPSPPTPSTPALYSIALVDLNLLLSGVPRAGAPHPRV